MAGGCSHALGARGGSKSGGGSDRALEGEFVHARSVNCAPGSVLKMSGGPWWRRASSSASMQKALHSVLDNRQASTTRLVQSMRATRYAQSCPSGTLVMSRAHT
jgi:hypothetical protein